ncbi:hypothetical protein PAPHI01_0439 [Pancytospora philotis]|nr:hypothetical protein PAPHI01_0439 [Pancytospora philotis]
MVAVTSLALGTVLLSLFGGALMQPGMPYRKQTHLLNKISPFKAVLTKQVERERTIFNALCVNTKNLTEPVRKYEIPKLIETLVVDILSKADPVKYVKESIAKQTLIFEYAMVANTIRFECGKLKTGNYAQLAGISNELLCTRIDETIKGLEEAVKELCELPFAEFHKRISKQNPYGRYDLTLFLFGAHHHDRNGGEEAVQNKLRDIIKTGFAGIGNEYGAASYAVQDFLEQITKTASEYGIDQKYFSKPLLESFTSRKDEHAALMLYRLDFCDDRVQTVLSYITDASHEDVSPYFVLQYIAHVQKKQGKNDNWAAENMKAYFLEPQNAIRWQRMLDTEPGLLRLMPARLLLDILQIGVQDLRSNIHAYTLFSRIVHTLERSAVDRLVKAAGEMGDADFKNTMDGFYGLFVKAGGDKSGQGSSAIECNR